MDAPFQPPQTPSRCWAHPSPLPSSRKLPPLPPLCLPLGLCQSQVRPADPRLQFASSRPLCFSRGGGCLCSFPHLSTAPFFFGLGPLTEAETRTGCRCVSGASRGQEGARGPEARSLQVQVSVHLAAAETPGGPGGVGWPGSTCHASLEG